MLRLSYECKKIVIHNKVFILTRAIKRHVRNEHGTEYVGEDWNLSCKHCPRVFKNEQGRYHHMVQEHSDHFRLECKICGAKLQSERALKGHMAKAHPEVTGPKGLEFIACKHCGERFSFHVQVRAHTQVQSLTQIFKLACQAARKP